MGYSPLSKHRHDSTPIKSCECMKSIICLRENDVMHLHLLKQFENTATIQQVIDLVDGIVSDVCVVLVSTWAWDTQIENVF